MAAALVPFGSAVDLPMFSGALLQYLGAERAAQISGASRGSEAMRTNAHEASLGEMRSLASCMANWRSDYLERYFNPEIGSKPELFAQFVAQGGVAPLPASAFARAAAKRCAASCETLVYAKVAPRVRLEYAPILAAMKNFSADHAALYLEYEDGGRDFLRALRRGKQSADLILSVRRDRGRPDSLYYALSGDILFGVSSDNTNAESARPGNLERAVLRRFLETEFKATFKDSETLSLLFSIRYPFSDAGTRALAMDATKIAAVLGVYVERENINGAPADFARQVELDYSDFGFPSRFLPGATRHRHNQRKWDKGRPLREERIAINSDILRKVRQILANRHMSEALLL